MTDDRETRAWRRSLHGRPRRDLPRMVDVARLLETRLAVLRELHVGRLHAARPRRLEDDIDLIHCTLIGLLDAEEARRSKKSR